MADLSEVFDVSRFAFTRNLSIEPGGEDTILLTSKENGFISIDPDTKKLIRSWPIMQNSNLSTSGVFHPGEQKFYAVFQDSILRSWNKHDSCLSNASTVQLNCRDGIQKLHPIVHKGVNDLAMVDCRGKVRLLSRIAKAPDADNRSQDGEISDKKRYIWSSILSMEQEDLHMIVISEEGQKYKAKVIKLKKINETLIFERTTERVLIPVSKGSHLTSSAVYGQRLFTLWSDNSVCRYNLPLDFNHHEETNMVLQGKRIFTLPSEFKVAGKAMSKARIGIIDENHLFVASNILIDKNRAGVVAVYSTKFGTEQARVQFPLSPEDGKSTKEENILAAEFHSGHVFLALSKSLVATSCRIHSSSLAASLGKLKRPREQISKEMKGSAVESPYIVTAKLGRLDKEEKWRTDVVSKNAEEQKALDRLSDPNQTLTVENFDKELDAFLKKLKLQAVEENELEDDAEEPKSKRIKTGINKQARNLVVPDQFIQVVLKRCFSDDKLWSNKIVIKILKTNCVSPSFCPELLQKICEKDALDVMKQCLKHIKGIPEQDILKCIQHLLCQKLVENRSGKLKNFGFDKIEDFKLDAESYDILLDIFNYPLNDSSMQAFLRLLDAQETMMLLVILLCLLLDQVPGIEARVSHEKVIDWLSMIINARFTSLIINNDSTKLIKQIKKIVQNQMKLFEKLETLEPHLMYFKNCYELPSVKNVSDYSLDTITL